MAHDITRPLRLAVGSHIAGSGAGCAMNVLAWETGEATITDLPACSDPFLARVVQAVNDHICPKTSANFMLDRNGLSLLCPKCSVKVLALAHRTVGTGHGFIDDDLRFHIYNRFAYDLLNTPHNHPFQLLPSLTIAQGAARALLHNPMDTSAVFTMARSRHHWSVFEPVTAAQQYFADAMGVFVTFNTSDRAGFFWSAWRGLRRPDDRVSLAAAHQVITRFKKWAELPEGPAPDPDLVQQAIDKMLTTRPPGPVSTDTTA